MSGCMKRCVRGKGGAGQTVNQGFVLGFFSFGAGGRREAEDLRRIVWGRRAEVGS